ncbi:Indolepyruvate ferredoxin oxidoreductase, alpha and beta subunits [Desulfitobacterium sp. LBE]|uniref:4Fe-4S ferredoxin iron-sulfur binding domain protein n=1 Tax=Desulfitobacterium hafniense (strain DSM 10664 / DCB-2) TaxID=272564 RepID=B8FP57_DESHD|nr:MULTISPECIES: 4Fe-4S binding protein [Desulfitobacterium]ACL19582.1 4Fe-4S ferredoxin iron-sulfur binding domain protein [Desulfitobacterium hafniense DCB-2]TWH57582.1 Indolepyruvate ferredoxin oxidoreductase, alpha and beta subunits [Desulfitobacterium sp. LBE]
MSVSINLNRCDGCGLCISQCPAKVLELKEVKQADYNQLNMMGKLKIRVKGNSRAYVSNESACTRCKLCQNNCHERAIKVG